MAFSGIAPEDISDPSLMWSFRGDISGFSKISQLRIAVAAVIVCQSRASHVS